MSLPDEIYLEIFSYLPQHHLRPVLQTCRTFTRLVKPLVFKTLHLDGNAQEGNIVAEWKPGVIRFCPGRSRTTELASLKDTVDELIAFDILRHVRKLNFSPRYYVEGFWSSFRQWLQRSDVQEDFRKTFEVSDTGSDDGECYRARRLALAPLARPEVQQELIVKAESVWTEKVAQQRENAEENLAALVKLFLHMPNLKGIEIRVWSFDLGEYGFPGSAERIRSFLVFNEVETFSHELGEQFGGCSTIWKHLELLSSAVQLAKIRIASLSISKIDLFTLKTNHALENLFSSLAGLSLNVENSRLTRDAVENNEASPFAALLRRASQNLENLECGNVTTWNCDIPNYKNPLLNRLFGGSYISGPADTAPLVFPALKTLKLRDVEVDAAYLIDFVSQQPKLQYAHFDLVGLTSERYLWGDVAEHLPPSCKKLYIGNCGHGTFDPDTPVVGGKGRAFFPYVEGFPATSDWTVDESFLDQEMDDHLGSGPPGAPPGSGGRYAYATTAREEMRAQYITLYQCAVFRRS
ncbi:hypothetical protein AA0113_g8704 [Alternaria arborescens]|uniref:F-box domain-containing protein n=1 Tax=Alternaria arborescens TaxID=156630 RepID=A0A4Q4RFR9_9PLEO|nr:hypothetical protein AA0113_g8704 [Alternaria arborescens]